MLIAEELHLLLTDATGAPVAGAGYRAHAEIAALVVDLVRAGRVAVGSDGDARLEIVSTGPTGSALLDTSLARFAPFDGERLGDVVTRPDLDPWDDIAASLVASGVLEQRRRRFPGITSPYARERDASAEAELRERLAGVLAGDVPPTAADATLLQLVQAIGVAPRVLADESGGLDDAALALRIRALSADVRVAGVVEATVENLTLTILAAAVLPIFLRGLT